MATRCLIVRFCRRQAPGSSGSLGTKQQPSTRRPSWSRNGHRRHTCVHIRRYLRHFKTRACGAPLKQISKNGLPCDWMIALFLFICANWLLRKPTKGEIVAKVIFCVCPIQLNDLRYIRLCQKSLGRGPSMSWRCSSIGARGVCECMCGTDSPALVSFDCHPVLRHSHFENEGAQKGERPEPRWSASLRTVAPERRTKSISIPAP